MPVLDDSESVLRIAVAVGLQAQAEGHARLRRTAEELRRAATDAIARSRESVAALGAAGLLG